MRLNVIPFLFAPPHVARTHAPSTFAELITARAQTVCLPVWEGASDQTIWGTPQANHAFRAWHDACHVLGGFDYSLEGERATARMQCQQLEQRCLGRAARAVWWDVVAQAEHFAVTGAFPGDQIALARAEGIV